VHVFMVFDFAVISAPPPVWILNLSPELHVAILNISVILSQ